MQWAVVAMHIRHGDKIGLENAKYLNEKLFFTVADSFFNKTIPLIKSRCKWQ